MALSKLSVVASCTACASVAALGSTMAPFGATTLFWLFSRYSRISTFGMPGSLFSGVANFGSFSARVEA